MNNWPDFDDYLFRDDCLKREKEEVARRDVPEGRETVAAAPLAFSLVSSVTSFMTRLVVLITFLLSPPRFSSSASYFSRVGAMSTSGRSGRR